MSRPVLLAPALLLAACSGTPDPEADRSAAVTACAAAVARHVGKPVDAVAATWTGASAEGIGVVTVTDAGAAGGERLHTCEVGASGEVRAIRHPGA
jgi:hypothetical protein